MEVLSLLHHSQHDWKCYHVSNPDTKGKPLEEVTAIFGDVGMLLALSQNMSFQAVAMMYDR